MAGDRERWQRVGAVFDELVDLPPSERAERLTALCGGDAELRREVEELLATETDPLLIVDTPAGEYLGTLLEELAGTEVEQPPEPAPGTIGPYRVLGELGRGGMGVVYLAERADGEFEQQVALKLVKRGLDTDEVVERFRRERQILARLEHPGIARLLDGGVTEDGRPYFALERIEGEPIDVYCDVRRLGVEERLRLFLKACLGVEFAQRNLVVHRDLKPSNLLVTESGEVKLLDFGIAKLLGGDEPGGATALTRLGLRVLTPEYAAPEQLRGEGVSTATDVYALGLVLFELLTGERPELGRGTTRDTTRPSSAVRDREAAEARGSSVPGLSRRLAGDLDAIVLKALREEPGRRYPSADALARDLDRHLRGLPVEARPESLGYRLGKLVKRHRIGTGLSAAIVLALTLGIVGMGWQAAKTRREAARAAAVSRFLFSLFEAADPAEHRGAMPSARDLLDRGAERVDALGPEAGPEIRVDMLTTLAKLYGAVGLYDQKEALARRAVDESREAFGTADARTADALHAEGDALFRRSQFSAAEVVEREAVRVGRQAGLSAVALAEYRFGLAAVLDQREKWEEAEELFREVLRVKTEAFGADHEELAGTLMVFGGQQAKRERFGEAREMISRALEIRRNRLPRDHPLIAASLQQLGFLEGRLGRWAEAEKLHREALELRLRVHGEVHPSVAISFDQVAMQVENQGRLTEADELYSRALETMRRLLGDDNLEVAETRNNLAINRYRRGDYAGAVELMKPALEVWRATLGTQHSQVGRGYNTLGAFLREVGDYEASEAAFRESLAILTDTVGPEHRLYGQTLNQLGGLLLLIGNLDEAERTYRRSLEIARREYDEGHIRIADVTLGLGATLVELGRSEEALPVLDEALAIRSEALSPEDGRIAEATLWLGAAHARLGNRPRAEVLLKEAHRLLLEAWGAENRITKLAASELSELGS